jgi:hypothetical protein
MGRVVRCTDINWDDVKVHMEEHLNSLGPEEYMTLPKDEYIAMKMLTRFKELKREDPKKPHPDIGWMLEILDVVREYDK